MSETGFADRSAGGSPRAGSRAARPTRWREGSLRPCCQDPKGASTSERPTRRVEPERRRLRRTGPGLEILLRADSSYAREEILAWCEDNGVDYVIGLARNSRLVETIGWELADAQAEAKRRGRPPAGSPSLSAAAQAAEPAYPPWPHFACPPEGLAGGRAPSDPWRSPPRRRPPKPPCGRSPEAGSGTAEPAASCSSR